MSASKKASNELCNIILVCFLFLNERYIYRMTYISIRTVAFVSIVSNKRRYRGGEQENLMWWRDLFVYSRFVCSPLKNTNTNFTQHYQAKWLYSLCRHKHQKAIIVREKETKVWVLETLDGISDANEAEERR